MYTTSSIFYGFGGKLSIYLDTKSYNVHSNPWVVMLRNALTPRPRYIRAIPAIRGFGSLGSGPGSYVRPVRRRVGDRRASDESNQRLPRGAIRFSCESALLNFGLNAGAMCLVDSADGKAIKTLHTRQAGI